MKFSIGFAVAVSAAMAAPAFAQAEDKAFDGPYVGVSVGGAFQSSAKNSTIQFDTDGDGRFGDPVLTSPGANAFSPGFCRGAARTNLPSGGCRGNKDGVAYAVQAGYDKQLGKSVIGAFVDFGKPRLENSVSAFSVTPASFTLTRKIQFGGRADVRFGRVVGGNTLVFLEGGGSYARVKNRFATTVPVTTTSDNGASKATGYNVGGGAEHRFNKHMSLGLEYFYTRLSDNDYRLSIVGLDPTPPAGGGAPPSGGNSSRAAAQTIVFKRGDDHFSYSTVSLVAKYRF